MFMWVKSVFPKPFEVFDHSRASGGGINSMQTLDLPTRDRKRWGKRTSTYLSTAFTPGGTLNCNCGRF